MNRTLKILDREKGLNYLWIFLLLLLILGMTNMLFAFELTTTAAGNVCDSSSPCNCGSGCNGGGEPGDATIDNCEDGGSVSDPHVQDIYVVDQSSGTFNGRDTIQITGVVQCSIYEDQISFAYHNGSGWRNVYKSPQTCTVYQSLQYYYKNITLDNVAGTHTVRVIITDNGGWAETCGGDDDIDPDYSDTDDISFTVIASATPDIAVQSLDNPLNASATVSTFIDFNFTASSSNPIDNCSLFTDSGGWSNKRTIYNVTNNTVTNFSMSLSEGSYIWNVYCTDNNSFSAWYLNNYTVNIDLSEPTITIYNPVNNSFVNSSTVTISVNHSDANPDSLILSVDNTNQTTQTYSGTSSQITSSSLADGTHTYLVYINDSAGNMNVSIERTVIVDTTNPASFELISPANNSQALTGAALIPLFDWQSSSDTNFSNYTLQISTDQNLGYVNHTRYTYLDSNSSYQFDEALANNLTWYWRVIAMDKAGNKKSSNSTFIYITNTTDLVVTLNSPTNNFGTSNTSVTMNYLILGSDLDSCSLFGNFSGVWQINQTNSSVTSGQSDSFDSVTLNEGSYIWNVRCNTTSEVSEFALNNYTFVIDTINPQIDYINPTPANNSNLSTNTFVINVSITETNPDTLILAWNGTNESYTYSGNDANISKTVSTDGTYSYYVWVNDSAGNDNQTETRFILIDTTAPDFENLQITPGVGTNLTIFNITLNITDVFTVTALSQIVYPDGTALNFSMINYNNLWYYEFNNSAEGIYNVTIFANDTLTNSNFSNLVQFTIDLSPPVYQDITELEDPLSGDKDQIITVNVSDKFSNVSYVLIYFNDVNHTMNLTSTDTYSYIWNVSNLGTYNYSFFANDTLGFWNSSATFNFTINDTIIPNISNVDYSPNTDAGIDPNVTIVVNANVSDKFGVNSVILQYKEDTNQSIFSNVTMSENNSYYTGNFTPTNSSNYTFRVYATDNFGNINISENYTVEAIFDMTWNRTPSLFIAKKAEPGTLVTAGTLTINNTGDFALNFDLVDNSTQPNLFYEPSSKVSLNPKETADVTVKAQAPDDDGNYHFIVYINVTNSNASPNISETTGSIVVGDSNVVVQLKNPITSVKQGATNVPYSAIITNIGNQTEYNVISQWTLPEGFMTRDSINMTISIMPNETSVEHFILVNVLSNAPIGSSLIFIKVNYTNGTTSNDSKVIEITGDAPPPAESSGSTSSGGGGTTKKKFKAPDYKISIKTISEIEVLRGESANFTVSVVNDAFGSILSDIEFEITGFKSGYVRVVPDITKSLEYKEEKQYHVFIDVPGYMRESKYDLNIFADAIGTDIYDESIPKKEKSISTSSKVLLIIHEVAVEEANCLPVIKNQLADMESKGFNLVKLKKIFSQANNAERNKDYRRILEYCEELQSTIENAFLSSEKINELELKINKSIEDGNDVTLAARMLDLAKDAFDRGNFNKAYDRLSEVELSLGFSQIEQFSRIGSLIRNNWHVLLVAILLVSGSGLVTYRATEGTRIRNKLELLSKEGISITNLIKKTQTNYFIDRIIGMHLYESYMKKYRTRIAEVQRKFIEIKMKQNAKANKRSKTALADERDTVEKIIGALQKSYYEKKLIDKDSYKKMFSEFKNKLAELDKKLVTKESKRLTKKKQGLLSISDPKKYFYLHDGKTIKSLVELLEQLKNMPDDIFNWHVNSEKNDFSSWIKDVHNELGLAADLDNEKTRENIINVIDIHISKFQK